MDEQKGCYICGFPNILDEHHIWPQFAGGEAGPTVDLCANCHSGLHRSAAQALSKKPKNVKYFSDHQLIKAQPLINWIVVAMQRVRENPNMNQAINLYLKPNRKLMTALHLLKVDAGFTNMNDFCLAILTRYVTTKL